MRSALPLALAGLLACGAGGAGRTTAATAAPPLPAAFALSAPLPARYLRTLEHDPGGYDDGSPPGGPARTDTSDLLLGDLLFHSPATLGARAWALGLSCQSCHPNGAVNARFVLPGIANRPGIVDVTTSFFRAGADDGIDNGLAIPSLRGARFTGPYGHDGRIASLAEFTQGVVTAEFGGAPLDARKLSALVHYVQDLDFLPNANLDARSHLTSQVGESARRGETLFNQPRAAFAGASCASCHVPSTFFRDGRIHRLGTVVSPSPHAVDDGIETPTLLGTSETAPYFHDGRFASLRDVVAWFDGSYGLRLSSSEREDLTAYVEAIGAVDRRFDERPIARALSQSFAYIAFAADDDPWLRGIAVDLVLVALTGEPASLTRRAADMRHRLRALRRRVAGAPIDRGEARALRHELTRLAADWGGATSITAAAGSSR